MLKTFTISTLALSLASCCGYSATVRGGNDGGPEDDAGSAISCAPTCRDALTDGATPCEDTRGETTYAAIIDAACGSNGACLDACAEELCSGEPVAFPNNDSGASACWTCLAGECFQMYSSCANGD